MIWALLAVLAAFIWGIVNIIDKYLVDKLVRKTENIIIILGIVGIISGFVIFLARGFSPISSAGIALALAAGIFQMLGNIFYFKAAKFDEISRVVPLFQLAPVFVIIMAAIFLGEIFTPLKYLGIFMIIIGAVLITKKRAIKFSFNKTLQLMILSALSFSINLVIGKYLLETVDYWTVFSYMRFGNAFVLAPLLYFYRKDFMEMLKTRGGKTAMLVTLNETLNLVGVFLLTAAAAYGFITLVEALASTQSMFLFIFAVIISIFKPKILKEELGKSTLMAKFIAIALIIAGSILLL